MVLTILKILGMILLVVIMIIILLLALILFVPIRYRFSAEYFEKPDVFATVRYAPVGLNAQLTFREDGLQYTIKALGGVIMTNTDERLSWLGRKIFGDESGGGGKENDASFNEMTEDDKETAKDNVKDTEKEITKDTTKQTEKEITKDTTKQTEKEITKDTTKQTEKKHKYTDDTNVNNSTKKTGNRESKKRKKGKRPISERIEEKIGMIKEKITKLNKKKEGLIKVVKSKRFEKAKSDVIRYIRYILMSIKPKHVEGRVHFGMDDPAATGEILGGIAVILPLYDGFLDIRPDFERKVIEGLLKGYGKIRLWIFAKTAIKVIFNKNLIKVIKRVQTIVEA